VVVRVEALGDTDAVEAPRDAEAPQGTVRIAVADTGPGIAPAAQATIFDRFEQADTSTTRAHEGTGLGLALTRELVELHGGTIDVESAPGEGATFTVRVPLLSVAEPVGETRRRGGAHVGDNGMGDGAKADERATILVVEDNAEMRAYLREQLARRWAVVEAADGEAGWEQVRTEAPDLVLSDVMMPGTDGFALCRRVKGDEDLRTIPVLLLTARAGEAATREGLRCGADDYVAKPFDMDELRQRIANHLAARRHLQARYREEVEIGSAVVDEENRSFVEELLSVIDEHLGNPDLTVGQLAGEMALSRRQLTRRVKGAIGEPPGAVLRTRRMERAKVMLERDPETISEVAYAVGFKSSSSFSQSFREHVGTSPSAYAAEQGD
jgi:DNA-binding response OmpR family regulator